MQRRPEGTPFAYILPSPDAELAKNLFRPVFTAALLDEDIDIEFRYVQTKSWYELWHGGAFPSRPPVPEPVCWWADRTSGERAEFTKALNSLDRVGISILLGSRLVPKQVVEQKADELATFMAEAASPAIIHLGTLAASAQASFFEADTD